MVSNAVRDKLSPRPVVSFARPKTSSGQVVLVVNVPPSLASPIGVRVRADKSVEKWGDDEAWAFPRRVGTDAVYLLPEQLAMMLVPEIRRHLIVLMTIPMGTPIELRVFNRHDGVEGTGEKWAFDGVDEVRNVVMLRKASIRPGAWWLPIDQLQTVYQDHEGTWHLAFRKHR